MTWTSKLPLRVRAFVAARAGRTDHLAAVLDADPSLLHARASLDPESLENRYVPTGLGHTLLFEAVLMVTVRRWICWLTAGRICPVRTNMGPHPCCWR